MGAISRLFIPGFSILAIGFSAAYVPARAQSSPAPLESSGPQSQLPIPVDQLKPPRAKFIAKPDCDSGMGRFKVQTCEELLQGTEGWVLVDFMIDPSGKPFEVAVSNSTGNKTFEDMAIRAIRDSTFEPATLNGKPVESNARIKILILSPIPGQGAKPQFINAYKDLMKSISAGDHSAADAAMAELKITNLYEDAYYGLAAYSYAVKWGDESQQFHSLQRAVAEENYGHYLPADAFKAALLTGMKLELKMNYYTEALATWEKLRKLGVDHATEAQIQPVIDQLAKLRLNDEAFTISSKMSDEGGWGLHLFKENFRIVAAEKAVSEVKLKCNRGYVSFKFDPEIDYHTPFKNGACRLELVGSPGTQFKLVQF